MTEGEKFWMLKAMEIYGGSFVKAMGMAWRHASEGNSAILENAFPVCVKEYQKMGLVLKKKWDKELTLKEVKKNANGNS